MDIGGTLRDWFDGADYLTVAVAVVPGVIALFRQRGSNRASAEARQEAAAAQRESLAANQNAAGALKQATSAAQRSADAHGRIAAIEEQRRAEEVERKLIANVDAEILSSLTPSGNGFRHRLVLTNRGAGHAVDVSVYNFTARSGLNHPRSSAADGLFPIVDIASGTDREFPIHYAYSMGDVVEVHLSWKDGRQDRIERTISVTSTQR